MNIFVSSPDPQECARVLDDQRCIKMVLETAQLLSCAVHAVSSETWHGLGLYRPTHQNHPCTKWTWASRENFQWLVAHGYALADEYSWRFGRTHKSLGVIRACDSETVRGLFVSRGLTPWPNVTTFSLLPIHTAYRKALQVKWAAGARWTRRERPEWWRPSSHVQPSNMAPASEKPNAHLA